MWELSEAYGWVTKFVIMMWLLESVLALVFIGIAATTGLIYGGPVGALVLIALWTATGTPVYYWNKARNASRSEAYDDRLTDERMAKGRAEVISQFEKQRKDETAAEPTE